MFKKRLFFSLVSVFFLLATLITASYAWYVNVQKDAFQSPNITGYSTAAYFAGGDGSSENPYRIANRRHLYNLAWLQYLGEFNEPSEEDKSTFNQVYFILDNNINCLDEGGNSLVIPPIGTTKYPFIGNFNGNGYVISNVVVQNTLPDVHPSSVNELKDTSIVGFFGVIGKLENMENSTLSFSSTVNSVSKFYLNNIGIKSSGQTLLGLIAGYVNGNLSNVGVHYSHLNIAGGVSKLSNFDHISSYALVGDYDNANVAWDDAPTDVSDGAGNSYGGSTNIKKLWDAVGSNEIVSNQAFPISVDSYSLYTPDPNPDTEEVETSINIDRYDGYNPKSFSVAETSLSNSSNIGYYVGNDIKFYEQSISKITSTKFWYPSSAQGEPYELPYKENGTVIYNEPSDDIKNYTINSGASTIYTMRLQGTVDCNQTVCVVGGQVGDYVGNIVVPKQGIWIAPRKAGTLKFVMINPSDGEGFTLYRIKRLTPGNYATQISDRTALIETNNLSKLIEGYMYYFEWQVTKSDVDAGYEYVICKGSASKGAYIWYIDIGARAASDGTGSESKPTGTIKDVDFVLDVEANEGNKFGSTSYVFSDSAFQINGTSTNEVVYYFRRNIFGEVDIVLYFIDPKNNGLSFTNLGNGKKSDALDKSCTTYVGSLSSAEKIELAQSAFDDLTSIAYDADSLSKITYAQNVWNSLTAEEKTSSGLNEATLTAAVSTYNTAGASYITGLINELPAADSLDANNYEENEDNILEVYSLYNNISNEIKALVSSDTVTKLNTVYEKYVSILPEYTVSFSGIFVDSQKVKKGFTTDKPSVDESTYYLLGWYTDEELTNEFSFNTPITEDITLYAKTINKYTVYFNVTASNAPSTAQTNIYGLIDKPTDPISYNSYNEIFDDWYLDNSYTTVFDFSKSIDEYSSYISNNSITLYGKFITKYSVYLYDGGTLVKTIDVGAGKIIEEPILEKYGYILEGWYTDSGFTNKFDFTNPITAYTTVYAKWTRDESISEITVEFNSNGGTAVSSQTIYEGQTVVEPTEPTKDGYTFDGWYSDEALTAKFDFETEVEESITLYAKWLKTHIVTFNTNGGTSVENQTVIEGQTVTIPITPTKDNYTFGGWYSDELFTVSYDFTTIIDENITLYAKWTESISKSIDFNDYELKTYDTNSTVINDSIFVLKTTECKASVVASTLLTDYSQVLLGNSNSKGFSITANKTGKITILFAIADSGQSLKNGTLTANNVSSTSSSTAEPTELTFDVEEGKTYDITVSANRFLIYAIEFNG